MNDTRYYCVSYGEFSTAVSATTAGGAKSKWLASVGMDGVNYTDIRARRCDPPIDHEQNACDQWNRDNPVGSHVQYWTGVREGSGQMGQTRTTARQVSRHAVVWVTGHPACISLTHIERITP